MNKPLAERTPRKPRTDEFSELRNETVRVNLITTYRRCSRLKRNNNAHRRLTVYNDDRIRSELSERSPKSPYFEIYPSPPSVRATLSELCKNMPARPFAASFGTDVVTYVYRPRQRRTRTRFSAAAAVTIYAIIYHERPRRFPFDDASVSGVLVNDGWCWWSLRYWSVTPADRGVE